MALHCCRGGRRRRSAADGGGESLTIFFHVDYVDSVQRRLIRHTRCCDVRVVAGWCL